MSPPENASDPTESLPASERLSKLQLEHNKAIAEASVVATNTISAESRVPSRSPSPTDEATLLRNLTEGVRDQDDLQREIAHQASVALNEKEDERDQKRIDKVNGNKNRLISLRQIQKRRLDSPNLQSLIRHRAQTEIDRLDAEIVGLDNDIRDIQQRIDQRHQNIDNDNENDEEQQGNRRLPHESQRDFLIRTGKITPFARMPRAEERVEGELAEALMEVEDEATMGDMVEEDQGPISHQNLRLPGFAATGGTNIPVEDEFSLRPRKKRRLMHGITETAGLDSNSESPGRKEHSDAVSPRSSSADFSDADFSAFLDEDDGTTVGVQKSRKKTIKSIKRAAEEADDLSGIDDGNEKMYQTRLNSWVNSRSRARLQKQNQELNSSDTVLEDNPAGQSHEKEWFNPCPDAPDHEFENGLKLPGDIYPALFDYQKTGVQWLGELYTQQTGGIIGDEMGLGKTIQIISFLAGLHYSKKLEKPVIVVAPATVLRQWVNEFHRWWPPLRVSILHSSGSGMLNVKNEADVEDDEESFLYRNHSRKKAPKSATAAKRIVDRVVQQGHVLVTTYAGLQTYSDLIIPVDWDYAVLDEGHKIRNPNTAITIHCKELRTANRVILSGTPMQNNLVELWSLFDFVYPMRLGTLVNFRSQFEIPIKLGGYASATNLQILTATKCAETLKEAISPYLLQRLKKDVASDLPKKSEQVIFCKLTKPQRDAYETFLNSDDMSSILNRTRQSLFGIDILRKICNHPDLLDPKLRKKPGYKWGNPNKSGKMQIVRALLEMWQKKGDKILLFSQGVQMLDIIEEHIKSFDGFNYLRMDGSTAIKDRQTMVDSFNSDPDLHVFLLTTKVGGLGVNLTGANRVIIFDPDWNPSTDVQARERAWRLGQKKEVTIYRLMTAGTIEEKIYHRQIFKQFLADKVLKDPKQSQKFHIKDLYDLFTLGSSHGSTETGELFKGSEVHLNEADNSTERTTLAPQDSGWTSNQPLPPLKTVKDGIPWSGGEPPRPVEPRSTLTYDNGEVLKITGVAGLEAYEGDPSESRADEDRIMEGIFARSGVHSVLQHDHIINGKRVVEADRGMIERHAKKVAAEAAAELRKAGEAARHVPIGTVTWTGEFGEAGRPVNIRRGGGPSSAGVLSGLASRQGVEIGSVGSSRSATPDRGPQGRDFVRLIRDYIRRQGGSVPSQMLIVHFDHMCKTTRQTEAFKACLQEVATLQPAVRGARRGKWELNEEFK